MNQQSICTGLLGLGLALLSGQASATAVPGSGTWETTLKARDINHDGVVDAYYDTFSNLTWLADANLMHTSAYAAQPSAPQPDVDGSAYWGTTQDWARNLDVYGVTGWRLPTLVSTSSCTVMGYHAVCSTSVVGGSSELENLLETTLGNHSGALTNTGPFANVQAGPYWTGTVVSHIYGSPPYWSYDTVSGNHDRYGSQYGVYKFGWAVHDGDIAPAVPEPQAWVLSLFGLAIAAGVSRQRRDKAV